MVVRAAAIFHDIGIHEAERKHGSSAGRYQEIEGPPIAREILAKYDLDEAVVDHVCKIIANHHSAKDIDTIEFRILWDADWLINLPAEFANRSEEKLRQTVDNVFKTKTGHKMAVAVEVFLQKLRIEN